jgi:DNA-binding MarR family transcriptional regulator
MQNYYSEGTRQHLRLWLKLLKTTGTMETLLRNRLKAECDTTLPRFDVMAALDHHPDGLRMSELSSFLMVSNGNVTGIANRLVEEGLVARQTDAEDGRVQILVLTPTGKTQFQAMANKHAGWVDDILGPLKDDDIKQTMALLEQIQQHLGEEQ